MLGRLRRSSRPERAFFPAQIDPVLAFRCPHRSLKLARRRVLAARPRQAINAWPQRPERPEPHRDSPFGCEEDLRLRQNVSFQPRAGLRFVEPLQWLPAAGPRAPPRAASIFVRKGPVHGRPKVAPPGLSLWHPLRTARKGATSQATTRLREHKSRD